MEDIEMFKANPNQLETAQVSLEDIDYLEELEDRQTDVLRGGMKNYSYTYVWYYLPPQIGPVL
jgi:hypothetical protein